MIYGKKYKYSIKSASPVAQMVKNLPAMRDTPVPSLGWEDPLENGMASGSSILAWEIPWTEEPGGLQLWGCKRVGHDLMAKQQASFHFSSVTQSCPTLCDPMDCSTPALPVHHQLPEFIQTHVH